MIKVWLVASSDWAGRLIRLATFSRWNHAAIEIDGKVYESLVFGGVRTISAAGYAGRWKRAESVQVSLPNKQAATDLLTGKIGKPYDWAALFALPFREDWHDPDKWFCSELVAAALERGGKPLRIKSHRVTPRDLWLALPG